MKPKFVIPLAILALVGIGYAYSYSRMNGVKSDTAGISPDDQAMIEHCRMMPGMAACKKYREELQQPVAQNKIDRSTSGLNDGREQTAVILGDRQTFALAAGFVKKTINGKTIRMLAYNDQLPGPLLRVKQGSTATVAFTNKLDEPTTVHWHGLRLDNQFDGVPDVTQPPVKPGDSFSYQLKFPDVGLYWYHPHIREDYQQELGMYGLIWVEPTDNTTFDQVNQEAFLTLDDILLSGNDVYPFDKDRVNHTLMGRFGNTMLVNGRTDYTMAVEKGDVVRLGLVNTANTRVFRVAIPGVKMKVVGGDSGGYQTDFWADTVTLSPSERALVEVQFTKPGTYQLKHASPNKTYTLGTITVNDVPTRQDYSQTFNTLKNRSVDFAGLDSYYAKPADKELAMTINMPGMMGNMQMNDMMGGDTKDGIEWEDSMAMMNINSTNKSLTWILKDKATGTENEKIDYAFKRGDKVKIRLFNDKKSAHPMQHVIHFHGNRFVVLAMNGVKNTNLVWKDSVLVPVGATVDILLDVTNPGEWMAHCHISEHLEAKMMFMYLVE